MSSPLIMRLIGSSVCIARAAGNIVKDIMKQGDLKIVEKGINDLQTEADRKAQKCIIASITQQFPKVSIVGEEEQDPNEEIDASLLISGTDPTVNEQTCPKQWEHLTEDQITVWVDPLDGTSEYTQGFLDHVTVLIGFSVSGSAIAGVICQPFFNYEQGADATVARIIWGLVGLGGFGFERRSPESGRRIITTTRSHGGPLIDAAVNACQPSSIMAVGGAGHKVLLVMEGKADAYVFASNGCKRWDTCAPEALLKAAGGSLTDLHGANIVYDANLTDYRNLRGVLATNQNHDWYIQKIPKEVLEQLQ